MYEAQKAIITKRRNGEITRQQFCHAWSQLQGFDDTVKGYANKHCIFMQYRGRTARITNDLLVWVENHKTQTANTIHEMKTKIDIYAQGVKWT